MFLRRLVIRNYKSLQHVELEPTPLSVLVGPNGAGKSNFASAIDFLSDVYQHGLETAVALKGGYENIAFRKQRRTRGAMRFEVTSEIPEIHPPLGESLHGASDDEGPYVVAHTFSLRAADSKLESGFKVVEENYLVRTKGASGNTAVEGTAEVQLMRSADGPVALRISGDPSTSSSSRAHFEDVVENINHYGSLPGHEDLFVSHPAFAYGGAFARLMMDCRVFHFSPLCCRTPGVPTPNPLLSADGENLPAVVALFRDRFPGNWDLVMQAMRDIVPGLEDIETKHLHTKTLGLFFKEDSSSQPWTAEDVSDGTIRALSLLVAAVDPRIKLLVIEELENSAHPWIINVILNLLRKASENKNIFLTTHSPILVDTVKPSEVWVVHKKQGATRIQNLLKLDKKIGPAWEEGDFRLSDYLDSGLLPHVVPGGKS